MVAPVAVTKFEVKSHASPDEVRTPAKTRVEVVQLEGFTIGRFNFEPGWRWSECIKPVVKTDHCQASHVGYAVSGRLTVRMKDGTEKTTRASPLAQARSACTYRAGRPHRVELTLRGGVDRAVIPLLPVLKTGTQKNGPTNAGPNGQMSQSGT
ncbi:cupin domain-containing protein [Cupriavidus necator]|uniref:cupin domain-containing protein n=1 Tax=Cupriavidus necator TaxID=106590 RepID=UPI001EE65C5A|nr:cupin domain-containing protein [Cupriavidus necator]MDX6007622.1 cupin domain-containing protein [Cupriavidus necator]